MTSHKWMIVRIVNKQIIAHWTEPPIVEIIASEITASASGALSGL